MQNKHPCLGSSNEQDKILEISMANKTGNDFMYIVDFVTLLMFISFNLFPTKMLEFGLVSNIRLKSNIRTYVNLSSINKSGLKRTILKKKTFEIRTHGS